jgi:hypothetical protein
LRHDRRAGAEAVRDIDEADARAHPDHQLFRHARNVRHHQCGGGAEFDCEIAVGYRVERVAADVVEAERAGDPFTIDREGGAGQCSRTQRQAIDALAAVCHALGVAAEHFDIGQHVMAERDRLRDLHVGEAGEDGFGMLFRQVEQRRAQLAQQSDNVVDCRAQVKPDVGRHLIVARASGMQPLARIADQFGEPLFDIQMHVFEVKQPLELPGSDLGLDLGHTALDVRVVLCADDVLVREHFRMRERTLYIGLGQALVEKDRGGIALDQIGDGFGKTGRPGLAFFGKLCCHNWASVNTGL